MIQLKPKTSKSLCNVRCSLLGKRKCICIFNSTILFECRMYLVMIVYPIPHTNPSEKWWCFCTTIFALGFRSLKMVNVEQALGHKIEPICLNIWIIFYQKSFGKKLCVLRILLKIVKFKCTEINTFRQSFAVCRCHRNKNYYARSVQQQTLTCCTSLFVSVSM